MKTMTCKQLRGACDKEFHAETVEEMVKLSQKHGMSMKDDKAHAKIMAEMREKGHDPKAQEQYMTETKELFDSLPEDE